jgi:hypothetical protein
MFGAQKFRSTDSPPVNAKITKDVAVVLPSLVRKGLVHELPAV